MRTTLHILTLAATAFGLAWLLGQPLPAAAQSAASGAEEPAELRAVQLRKEGERLNVHFLLSAPPKMEVVDNLPKQVLVVKFRDAVPGIPEGKDRFLFNDPMVAGIVLEAVGPRETWAKVRLRKAALTYTVTELPTSNQVVISVAELPPSDRIGLEAVRVATEQTVSRVVLDLTRLPTFESDQVADRFLVRLSGVVSRLQAALEGGDERVELSNLEEDGDDTLLRIQLLRPNLESSAVLLDEPPQLVFVFRDAAEVAATPAGEAAGRLAEEDRPESVEVLLAAEPNPAVRATYSLAEREMRAGRYDAARSDFIRVFTTTPRSKLGVRAYFRAADAQYEILRAENARNYHGAVTSYQAAIRAAETANYDSDLIPRAFFQIARSYQHMDFHHESDAHFRILQDRFPGHPIYTPD